VTKHLVNIILNELWDKLRRFLGTVKYFAIMDNNNIFKKYFLKWDFLLNRQKYAFFIVKIV